MMKIGVFDSGKGGLSVLEEIKKVLPEAEYKYIADSKNCPYGEKSDAELLEIVKRNVNKLKEWGAKIIVIACNTATTRCIDKLRDEYSELKFVGTEPAIKLATESGAKNILVMATPSTVEARRTLELARNNKKKGQEIDLLACPGLADAIEFNKGVEGKLNELLETTVEYDCVVLGCTHYSLVKNKIQKFFPTADIIDGNKSVALRVKEVVSH